MYSHFSVMSFVFHSRNIVQFSGFRHQACTWCIRDRVYSVHLMNQVQGTLHVAPILSLLWHLISAISYSDTNLWFYSVITYSQSKLFLCSFQVFGNGQFISAVLIYISTAAHCRNVKLAGIFVESSSKSVLFKFEPHFIKKLKYILYSLVYFYFKIKVHFTIAPAGCSFLISFVTECCLLV